MNFQQVRHPIDYLIHRIRTGRLALPDFQRDFVWSPGQVIELLDSVSRQWPIGSLLLLSGPQPFAFRSIDSAPQISSENLDLYMLDGQQRVTALYHAVTNVSKYCYYVDFNEFDNGGYDAIQWERRAKFEREYPDVKTRAQAGIALIKDIWEHPAFFSWLGEISSEDKKERFIRIREESLIGLQSKVYHIMAIELEQGIELEALARIFETINRTGVALNAFDLLVAKLYPTKFNLRERWESAKESKEIFSRIEPGELEVLKLVSLLIRKYEGKRHSKGVRQGDLLSLDSNLIVKYWDQAISLYSDALIECKKFGVTAPELVPSWAMVLGMAGCILDLNSKDRATWWISRLLQQTFAQAANTKIVSEFDSSMAIDQSCRESYNIQDFSDLFLKSARANGLFTRGLIGLVAASGGRDFLTMEPLSESDNISFRWVSTDGQIRKLGADDSISGVFGISSRSEKKMSRILNIRDFPNGIPALESQGFDVKSLRRDMNYSKKLFALQVGEK